MPPAAVPLVPPLPVTASPSSPAAPSTRTDGAAMPEFKAVPPPDPVKIPTALPAPTPLPPLPSAALPVLPVPAGLAPPSKSAAPIKPVPPVAPDFSLRPGNGGNSVKSDASAGVPATPALPPLPQVEHTLPSLPAVPVKTEPALAPPAHMVSRAKPVDGPMPPTEKYVFAPPTPPVTHTDTLAPTPRGDPMTLKQSALAAALGGALAVAPTAPAAFPVPPVAVTPAVTAPTVPVTVDPPAKTADEKVKDLEKKVDDLLEMLKGKKDKDNFVLPTDPGLIAEVRKLKDEVAALKSQIDTMQKSTSLRPNTGSTTTPAEAPARGTVRIVNDYPIEIIMAVNDKSYHIAPNTKVDVPVAAGEFTYQLLNGGANLAPTRSVIKDKEVVTLRIK
jgi:hypothetical protein